MLGPIRETLVRATADVLGFLTAIVWGALVAETTKEPKSRFGGVRASVVRNGETGGGLAITMPNGVDSGKEDVTVFVAVEIRETVLLRVLGTYTVEPSGVTAMDCGALPTGIVVVRVLVEVLITDTELDTALTT